MSKKACQKFPPTKREGGAKFLGLGFEKTLNKEEKKTSTTNSYPSHILSPREKKTEERERETLGSDLLFSHAHPTPIFLPASSRDLVSVRAKRAAC